MPAGEPTDIVSVRRNPLAWALPMGINSFLIVAGCIFGLIALLQIARIAFRWPIRVASFEIPLAASWIAVLIAGGLCIWAFRLAII